MNSDPEIIAGTLSARACCGAPDTPPVSELHDALDGRGLALVHKDYRLEVVNKPTRHATELTSLESFPRWILAAGRQEDATSEVWLFWTDKGLTFIPETNNHPTLSHATLIFKATPEAELWGWPKFSKRLSQQELRRAIETTLATGEQYVRLTDALKWLEVVSGLKMVQTVSKEAVIEDRQNYKVAYESKSGSGSVSIPKELTVEFYPFEGSPSMVKVCMRVEFDWEGATPVFILEALGAARLVEQAAQDAAVWVVNQVNGTESDHPTVYLFKGAHKG